MTTSSNGNIFRVNGLLCGEFTGHRWIPRKRASEWRGAFMFSLICAWLKGWVNNREAGDLRRHQAHYDVIVMWIISLHHLHRAILKKSGGNQFHLEKNIYFQTLNYPICIVTWFALRQLLPKFVFVEIVISLTNISLLYLYHFHNSRRNKVLMYLYNVLALLLTATKGVSLQGCRNIYNLTQSRYML